MITPKMIDDMVKAMTEAEPIARQEEIKYLNQMSDEYARLHALCKTEEERKNLYIGFSAALRGTL